MKAKTLQIVWHSKEPVFSIDFHPDGYMATGGADKEIKIWELNCAADGSPGVRWAASLEGHNATVNCVRFSKTGHYLASAGDSGEIIVWKPIPAVPAAAVADGGGSPKSSTPPLTPGTAAAAAATPDAIAATAGSPAVAVKPFSSTIAPADAAPAKDAAAAAAAGRDPAEIEADGVVRGFKWKMSHTLRGHHDDVCDVVWAHDDAVLLTGSVENEVMMFDVHSRQNLQRLLGHRHYVQGVAWDPLGAWLVSASADRSVRVHGLKPPGTGSKASAANPKSSVQLARDYIHTATLLKRTLPAPATPPPKDNSAAAAAVLAAAPTQAAAADAASPEVAAATTEQQQQQQQQAAKPLQTFLFQDESLGVFFRRMAWSPDGMLLAIPAGMSKGCGGAKGTQHATHIYARGSWASLAVSLPCPAKASTAVKFCPLLFKLRQQVGGSGSSSSSGEETAAAAAAVGAEAPAGEGGFQVQNVLGLPYRLVLAVATVDTVLLYDMQTLEPFMLIGPLHYDQITDLAWSRDGSCLAVSSRDGYCSLVTFQPGELGDVITEQELPAQLLTSLQKVAAAAAATAANHSAASSSTIAVSPVMVRPVSAAAAAAASPAPASADISQQQQGAAQRPAIKRIQPQAVTLAAAGSSAAGVAALTAGTAVKVATVASSQPRRISPSPVAASPLAAAVAGGVGSSARPPSVSKAAAPAPRRLTPTPVNTAAAAAAAQRSSEVVDLTVDDPPAAAAPAAVQINTSRSTGKKANSSAAATAAAAAAAAVTPPAPRRLTPQAVSPAGQQQQQAGPSPVAAGGGGGISPAAVAAPQGRTGMAAVAAALAAAKKKAAAKRAAEGASEADGEVDAKRAKADAS